MICFRVTVNEELKCTAGVREGVLTTILNGPTHLSLHVGGLENGYHLGWVNSFDKLRLGDRVLVEIVEAETDPPIERYRSESWWSRHAIPVSCIEGLVIGAFVAWLSFQFQAPRLAVVATAAAAGAVLLPMLSYVVGRWWWRLRITLGARRDKSSPPSAA